MTYDHGWLAQITAAPTYLRRCNGGEGRTVSGTGLRVVLAASKAVSVDSDGVITWTSPMGQQFTAEPVHT